MKSIALPVFCWLTLATGPLFGAEPDQSYSKWRYSEARGYYYCQYHYKSNTGDRQYKEQLVIFNPKDRNWVYFCNPHDNPDNKSGKAKFWARCPTRAHPTFGVQVKEGKDIWSILPDDKKQSRLADLKDSDFPEAKLMCPMIPGSRDVRRTIACPPDPPNLPE